MGDLRRNAGLSGIAGETTAAPFVQMSGTCKTDGHQKQNRISSWVERQCEAISFLAVGSQPPTGAKPLFSKAERQTPIAERFQFFDWDLNFGPSRRNRISPSTIGGISIDRKPLAPGRASTWSFQTE